MHLDKLMKQLAEIGQQHGNIVAKQGDIEPFTTEDIEVCEFEDEDGNGTGKFFLHVGRW